MINYRVDDLDALLARLAENGVWIDPKRKTPTTDASPGFATVMAIASSCGSHLTAQVRRHRGMIQVIPDVFPITPGMIELFPTVFRITPGMIQLFPAVFRITPGMINSSLPLVSLRQG